MLGDGAVVDAGVAPNLADDTQRRACAASMVDRGSCFMRVTSRPFSLMALQGFSFVGDLLGSSGRGPYLVESLAQLSSKAFVTRSLSPQ